MRPENPSPREPLPDDGLERRQAEVRRGLIRAKSATALDLDPRGRYAVGCGGRGLFSLALERPSTASVWLPDSQVYSVALDTEGASLFTTGPIGLQRWPL